MVLSSSTLRIMPRRAVEWTPAETHLHGTVTGIFILLRFRCKSIALLAVELAGVHRYVLFGASTKKLEYGLTGGLSKDVPDGDIDGADGSHGDALAAKRHGLAIHILPDVLIVERIAAEQDGLEIKVNGLLCQTRRQRSVPDSNVSRISEDLDDQPPVETK